MNAVSTLSRRLHDDPAWQNAGLAALLLVVGLALTAFGERIPLTHGLGYDGAEYGQWAIRFDAVLDGRIPVAPYRFLRMLPSLLAHGTLRLVGAGLTPENVIRFFSIYNMGLLCLAVLAWGGIADALALGGRGKLLGFIGLFCNHAILKFNFYYPVLTDVSGYASAIFLLWAFVRGRPWLAAATTLAGAFCWPPILVYGAVVLLFPRRDQVPGTSSRRTGLGMAAVAVALYFSLAANPLNDLTPYYPLAAAVVAAYLGVVAYALFSSPYSVWAMLLGATTPWRAAAAGMAVALVLLGRMALGHVVAMPQAGGFFQLPLWGMLLTYLRSTCIPLSTRLPGEFLVAHVLYFGPLLFLTVLFWRRAAAGRFGLGFFLLVALAAGHAIMPLSRQWLAGYPFVVLATVLAVADVPLSRGFLLTFTGVSLLLSKVWMLFNLTRAADAGPDGLPIWTAGFSFEHYVSSTGRWMPFVWYAAQGFVLAVMFLCYYWFFYSPRATACSVGAMERNAVSDQSDANDSHGQ